MLLAPALAAEPQPSVPLPPLPQPGPLACPENQLAPFSAEYEVYRNGRKLGQSVARLKKAGDLWLYEVDTEADKGLAGLLGGQVEERSRFQVLGSELRPVEYQYQQGIRFSRREGTAHFDWDRLVITGTYKKKDFELPLVKSQTDRTLVNLKLMRALAQGQQKIKFDTVERGRVDRMDFVRHPAPELLDSPAGRLDTVRVSRQHNNPKRHTDTWHAPELGYLAIRMRHEDGDDDEVIEMRLVRWERGDCRA